MLHTIDKFQYLTSCLIGKDVAAIDRLPISEQNYEISLKTKVKRLGKDEVIMEEHMSPLLAVHPVHNLPDTECLKTLYNKLQTGVRSHEALGVPRISISQYHLRANTACFC